jgi:hypothetical protein
MLAAHPFADVLSGKHGSVADVAAYALRAGLAVVFDAPGTKLPLCVLSDRKRREADRAAVDAAVLAKAARPHLKTHDCATKGHTLVGADAAQYVRPLLARLARRYGAGINLGIEPGRSRMVCVDVDTDGENQAFRRWLAERGVTPPPMTVRSPGKRADTWAVDGAMAHSDGGHYWFAVPDGVDLVAGNAGGVLKIGDERGAFTVMWAGRQILIPPSVRVEGAYVYTGAPVIDAPVPLIEAIRAHQAAVAEHALIVAERLTGLEPTSVDVWDARTPWTLVLEPHGWADTGKVDMSCGAQCAIWTAPGDHASEKSATAHEDGCTRYDTVNGWGPLHIWTDNPPAPLVGGSTITKLTFLALVSGLTRAQMCGELGIGTDGVMFDPDPFTVVAHVATPDPFTVVADPVIEPVDPFTAPDLPGTGVAETASVTATPETAGVSGIVTHTLSAMRNRGVRPPDLIAGMLGDSGLSRIIGRSNEGKTFVAVDIAASVATGLDWHGRSVSRGSVLYVNYEDNDGLMDRFLAWDQAHAGLLGRYEDNLRVVDPVSEVFISELSDASRARRNEFGRMIRDSGARLVIFDTQSMATVGADENDSTEMTKAVMWMKQVVARVPHCQLLLIHHRGHNGEHGRGSSAVYAAMDTELSVERPDPGKPDIVVTTTKQRAMAFAAPITVSLDVIAVDGLTRSQGVITHGDPFEVPATPLDSQPSLVLPEGSDWPDAVLAAGSYALVGANALGFSQSALVAAVEACDNLPVFKVSAGKTVSNTRRARIRTALDSLVHQGLIERDPKDTFRLTETALARGENLTKGCR